MADVSQAKPVTRRRHLTSMVMASILLVALIAGTRVWRTQSAGENPMQKAAEAVQVVSAGGVFSAEGQQAIAALDVYLRGQANNRFNPGTTADLIAATLFVALLEGL